jgi:hypothetical protein
LRRVLECRRRQQELANRGSAAPRH